MITLTNDFHKTSVRVRAKIGDILTASQMRRVNRKLCGSKDCKCGVVRGIQHQLSGDIPVVIEDVWDLIEEAWMYKIEGGYEDTGSEQRG